MNDKLHLGGYIVGGDPLTYYPDLWRWLISTFAINSVLDVGCGEGHSTKYFIDAGLDVLGIEGSEEAIGASPVSANIVKHDYCDGPFTPDKQFDLIWCCEFLEHVEEQYLDNILETMRFGRVIAISAALPGQDGYHHVNCQPSEYWVDKFTKLGYIGNERALSWHTIYARSLIPIGGYFKNNGLIFVKTANDICVTRTTY